MAEKLPNVLSDNELRSLRNEDDTMEQSGIIRSGSRMSWESAKGAVMGAVMGVPLAPFTLGLSVFAGAAAGAGANALWGSVAKGAAVKKDEDALQQAAIRGAQQNGQLTAEQAQELIPRRSLLKGALTSLGVGAGLGMGVGAGIAIAGLATAVTLTAAPLAIAAGAGALVYTAFNAYRNHRSNENMQVTLEKAASIGGMKARSAALQANIQQPAVAQEKSQGKFNELGALSAPTTPTVAKAASPQDKSKKTRS